MKPSPWAIEVVKAFEGFYAKPYYCPAGVLTQGYGHTAAAGAPPLGGEWTKDYATQVLRVTITSRYAAPVEKALKRKPTQAQFDAMTSLAYNIGLGWEGPTKPKGARAGFRQSSVLRCFNAGDDAGAVKAFAMWTKGGGKVLPGLVRRRAAEALMYQGIKDLDFDGRRDPDEPVYGPMAQEVSGETGAIKPAPSAGHEPFNPPAPAEIPPARPPSPIPAPPDVEPIEPTSAAPKPTPAPSNARAVGLAAIILGIGAAGASAWHHITAFVSWIFGG
jgi:GH24 family phage-related lysozyme (muramidase)